MNDARRAGGFWAVVAILSWAATVCPAQAQTPAPPQNEGIPVQSDLVRAKCGSCHRSDDKMRMTRISYRRATPGKLGEDHQADGDAQQRQPRTGRRARRSSSIWPTISGLAPEEARPIAVRRRTPARSSTPTPPTRTPPTTARRATRSRACSSERRTKEEWELLVAMHRGYYPLVDNQPMNGGQGFRRTRPPQTEPRRRRPPAGQPSPDGEGARASRRRPAADHAGVVGVVRRHAAAEARRALGDLRLQAGKGAVYGQVTVTADPTAPDSFNADTRYTIARTGETVVARRQGARLHRLPVAGPRRRPGSDSVWREVMIVDRDWKEMSGRWFTGAYDETGIDVKLVRLERRAGRLRRQRDGAEDRVRRRRRSGFSAPTFRPASSRKTSASARA